MSDSNPASSSPSIPVRSDYKFDAWKEFTVEQLGQWVSLLIMRSFQRTDIVKRDKDVYDAGIYTAMIQEHVNAAKEGRAL